MSDRPRPGVPVWVAGILFGVVAETALDGWRDAGRWLPDLVVGFTLLSCGLVAGRWRPEWWSGWLLSVAGFAWFVPNFSDVEPLLVRHLAAALLFVHRGPILHLVIAYPQGRTPSHALRAVIAGGYAVAVAQAFWPQPVLALGAGVVVLAVVVGRYAVGSRADRRARLVALVAAVAWAAVTGAEVVMQSVAPGRSQDNLMLYAYEAAVALLALGLTFGLQGTGWDRPLVTDLVVELGLAPSSDLRRELAGVLSDPGLEVGYWVDQTASYVDAEGRSLTVGADDESRPATVVQVDGRPVAILVHHTSDPADPGLVQAVSDAVRLVSAHDRLEHQVGDRVADVRASRLRILAVADAERARLEALLRGRALTRLSEVTTLLQHAQASAQGTALAAHVDAARHQLVRTQDDLQRFALGVHPRTLLEQGLQAALRDLTVDSEVPVTLVGPFVQAPPAVEAAAYYVCSEALANASKHSSATGVTVRVASPPGMLVVEIRDDGRGGADPARGSGLQGLLDRVAAVGGTLEVTSPRGGGTRLVATLPTSAPADAG
jgi:signal transduction histidine kinase